MFTPSQQVLIEKLLINKGAYLMVIAAETGLIYRFYLSRDPAYYSPIDLYLQYCIIVVTNLLLFVCLYRASTWDCGRVPKV